MLLKAWWKPKPTFSTPKIGLIPKVAALQVDANFLIDSSPLSCLFGAVLLLDSPPELNYVDHILYKKMYTNSSQSTNSNPSETGTNFYQIK